MNQLFEVVENKVEKNHSQFIISPLDQGYGYTLGNSLRRVLLGNIEGAAITSVEIKGVKHQFSTIKGMKEDVVDFVLNLKRVRFVVKKHFDKPQEIKLEAKGPAEVKAGDIKTTPLLEVVNPDMVIATLDKGGQIDAKMKVEMGLGYRLADSQKASRIGLIFVDAIFTPVVKVAFKVEETRVGRLTNFDKLVLDIWTDGSKEPKEVLVEASKILISHFEQIVSPKLAKKETKEEPKEDALGPVGKLSVEEINLPTRVANALIKAGYETVESLAKAKREDLVKVRNLGEKSLKIVKLALAEKGVSFLED